MTYPNSQEYLCITQRDLVSELKVIDLTFSFFFIILSYFSFLLFLELRVRV